MFCFAGARNNRLALEDHSGEDQGWTGPFGNRWQGSESFHVRTWNTPIGEGNYGGRKKGEGGFPEHGGASCGGVCSFGGSGGGGEKRSGHPLSLSFCPCGYKRKLCCGRKGKSAGSKDL